MKTYQSNTMQEKYVIHQEGTGEMKLFRLLTESGSKLLGMFFDSIDEAKKYADKKGLVVTDSENDSDDDNPAFMFQTFNTSILMKIAKGEIDPVDLARKTLDSRGLGMNGKWVGFKK